MLESSIAEQKKNSGSFYTPSILSNFVLKHIFENYFFRSEAYNVLEPSCGDGEFLKAFIESDLYTALDDSTLYFCEKDEQEYSKSLSLLDTAFNLSYSGECCDFLDFQENSGIKYNLIIGNPPYIDKRRLSEEQINKCKRIFSNADVKSPNIHNIWTAFVAACVGMLDEHGVLAFVLPAEILQVNYTSSIRQFLTASFSKIDIFAFNELIFSGTEQDVILLIASKSCHKDIEPGISFYQVDKLNDLLIPEYTRKHTNIHRKTLNKWTNYIVSDTELDFLDELKVKVNSITHYCSKIEVGIVTGVNNYFILNQKEVENRGLIHNTKTIVTRGSYVKDCLFLNDKTLNILLSKGLPSALLHIDNKPIDTLSPEVLSYLKAGIDAGKNLGYKCSIRQNWYHVPSTWVSNAVFVKRTHIYPRLLVNTSQVLVTDSFYRINNRENYDINNIAFSFYNTLTFIHAELEGRYYGGGVLELTPNEFKKLPLPYYKNIQQHHIHTLNRMLEQKVGIFEILDFTDDILLREALGVSAQAISRMRDLYCRLIKRRLKKDSI